MALCQNFTKANESPIEERAYLYKLRFATFVVRPCGEPRACHPAGRQRLCATLGAVCPQTPMIFNPKRFTDMAIFHLSAKIVSRGKGQSAIAKAAYNARDRITDERTGEVKDYSRKNGILFSGIFAPKDAPEWAHDRAELWNHAEAAETRKNSQLAREIEVSLPHELTEQQREYLIKDFVREQFVRHGMVADVNIHAPDRQGDERNYHAHILLTTREISPDGFTDKNREWNTTETLEKWREGWEITANRYLERFGHEERIDRRTLEAQGIKREPTQHQGAQITAMQRRGIETERGEELKAEQERSSEREKTRDELEKLSREISRLQIQTIQEIYRAEHYQQRKETAALVRESWTKSEHDGLGFMVALGEKGLQVAQTKKGGLVIVAENGLVHSLSAKTQGEELSAAMQEAIIKTKADGLVIPTVRECITEQRARIGESIERALLDRQEKQRQEIEAKQCEEQSARAAILSNAPTCADA
jgi:ATP-dependent exoDNAse (exonuclease V) alpha subunit